MPTPTPATTPQWTITASDSPQFGEILLLIFYLVLILVGVYYATRLLARFMQRGFVAKGRNRAGDRSIFIVERIALDREKSIVIVEHENKQYLLGVTPSSVTLIKEMEAPPHSEDEDSASVTKFEDVFQNITKAWRERGKQ